MRNAIPTFSSYIDTYINTVKTSGEHHFVASYLLPRVFTMTGSIPGFINPDGMKHVPGDLVSTDSSLPYSIEVKLGTIRLTANEFNNWVLNLDSSRGTPSIFVAIGSKGVIVSAWLRFVTEYKKSIERTAPKKISWSSMKKNSGQYGPMKQVDSLFDELPDSLTFQHSNISAGARKTERQFCSALSNLI